MQHPGLGLPKRSAENAPLRRDEAYVAEVPTRTAGDVRTVFSDSDDPAEAQKNGEEGTVQAKLDISASGRVERCTIVHSSGHPSLDTATCNILVRRARFAPARDNSGNARADIYVTPPVAWRLAE